MEFNIASLASKVLTNVVIIKHIVTPSIKDGDFKLSPCQVKEDIYGTQPVRR